MLVTLTPALEERQFARTEWSCLSVVQYYARLGLLRTRFESSSTPPDQLLTDWTKQAHGIGSRSITMLQKTYKTYSYRLYDYESRVVMRY
jgi:hypothetical protein